MYAGRPVRRAWNAISACWSLPMSKLVSKYICVCTNQFVQICLHMTSASPRQKKSAADRKVLRVSPSLQPSPQTVQDPSSVTTAADNLPRELASSVRRGFTGSSGRPELTSPRRETPSSHLCLHSSSYSPNCHGGATSVFHELCSESI